MLQDGTPAQLSGTETPVEVAELTSLPSLVVEGELVHHPAITDHPLSPGSAAGAGSPLPVRAVASSPALVSAGTGAAVPPGVPSPAVQPVVPVTGEGSAAQDPATSELLVNRVNYPAQQPGAAQVGAAREGWPGVVLDIFTYDIGWVPDSDRLVYWVRCNRLSS